MSVLSVFLCYFFVSFVLFHFVFFRNWVSLDAHEILYTYVLVHASFCPWRAKPHRRIVYCKLYSIIRKREKRRKLSESRGALLGSLSCLFRFVLGAVPCQHGPRSDSNREKIISPSPLLPLHVEVSHPACRSISPCRTTTTMLAPRLRCSPQRTPTHAQGGLPLQDELPERPGEVFRGRR